MIDDTNALVHWTARYSNPNRAGERLERLYRAVYGPAERTCEGVRDVVAVNG
jgi:hypothetical protein